MNVAIRLATIVVSAPTPASRPLHINRLARSFPIRRRTLTRDRGRRSFEAAADRLDDERLGALELLLGLRQHPEDPSGQQLLDRTVEAHGREVGRDVGLERAVLARLLDDPGDQVVRLADLL